MSDRAIIYVPGIKPKPPAVEHRAALWRCLLEGVRRADPSIAAEMATQPDVFQLASWTHLFYDEPRDLALDRAGIERVLSLAAPEPRDVREASSFGRRLKRLLYLLSDAFPPLFDLVSDPNMRATIKDTRRYFAGADGAAGRVRQLVTDALLDAWREDKRVLLIGHSLGSVIAFDVLWDLSHRRVSAAHVDFVSIGSPLGLTFVCRRLLGAREEGSRRYPTNIRRWTNIAAVGEMTALDRRLADNWSAMLDLRLVESIDDRLDVHTYFRGPEGLNVHKCYGYMVNPVVGDTIASWWICRK